MFADWILSREGFSRQALAEDADLWRTRRVILVEIASRQDWNTHGLKEAVPDRVVPRGLILLRILGLSLRQEGRVLHTVGNVAYLGERHVFHPGQCTKPLFDL